MNPRYTDKTEEWIGIGQASRMLGVSVDTLRRWESADQVHPIRTQGNQRRYRRSDIEALRVSQ